MSNNFQQRINEIQANYHEWLELQTKIEQLQQDLQRSVELRQNMENFYSNGEYQTIFEAIENGEKLDLTTSGEYSVMSEDTIWNALHEQDQMLWQLLRFTVNNLDKN